jgi:hypothetical protein
MKIVRHTPSTRQRAEVTTRLRAGDFRCPSLRQREMSSGEDIGESAVRETLRGEQRLIAGADRCPRAILIVARHQRQLVAAGAHVEAAADIARSLSAPAISASAVVGKRVGGEMVPAVRLCAPRFIWRPACAPRYDLNANSAAMTGSCPTVAIATMVS